ncbi:hypothetical protein RvY_07682-4 [Ramazzottius varieornatus]|uniref:Uncharacterized protein n=1 Tax=Ramazzottius varieornatus TaxID=947166 RepID=A0A1D1V333_RAMVA|nr:hypothetical protein RvY_07682-4 [Ramazzottius varieornatus]
MTAFAQKISGPGLVIPIISAKSSSGGGYLPSTRKQSASPGCGSGSSVRSSSHAFSSFSKYQPWNNTVTFDLRRKTNTQSSLHQNNHISVPLTNFQLLFQHRGVSRLQAFHKPHHSNAARALRGNT